MPNKKTKSKTQKGKVTARLIVPWYVTVAALAASIAAMYVVLITLY